MSTLFFTPMRRSLVAAACTLACVGAQAATIVVTSRDPVGIGFNDPTVVAPVGGNPGTTLGEQRMYVYRQVANLWEAAIKSDVTINVSAGWEALTCSANSAVLGSAGAWNIWHDFPGSKPGTWYPQALANKLAGQNLIEGNPDDGTGYGNVDIKTQFNINLGGANCLPGSGFYLGMDGNTGGKINFVATLLHELGHGLGFSVLSVQTSTGKRILADGSAYADNGLPSVWEEFMYDSAIGKTWLAMNSLERKASAISPGKLSWNGANAVAGAAATLGGTPSLKVTTPAPGYSGFYDYGTASFGPLMLPGTPLGTLARVSTNGCEAAGFSAADAAAIKGKVAIIDRGTCGFVIKVKNAQNAGAVAVLIADNVVAGLSGLGGTDPTITIPAARITKASGDTLKLAIAASVRYGSRTKPGSVSAAATIDNTRLAGADSAKRPLLYTPSPLEPGSSVSHWDTSAFPNLLMEPAISGDLTAVLVPPKDLTIPLFKDIGW